MPDESPKLSVIRKRRKRSVSSELSRRAEAEAKRAALEARKVAVLEYVGEKLDDLAALLRSEGFRVQRGKTIWEKAAEENVHIVTHSATPPPVENPCQHCGHPGKLYNGRALCDIHAQWEAQDNLGGKLAGQIGMPVAPPMNRPAQPVRKIVIHPNAQDEAQSAAGKRQPATPLSILAGKGLADGTTPLFEEFGDEAEADR